MERGGESDPGGGRWEARDAPLKSSSSTGSAQPRSGLEHDGALLTEPHISPLCGSQMKNSSSAFIAQVQIHPCDGTIRRERGRDPVCCDNPYLVNGSPLFELKEIRDCMLWAEVAVSVIFS